MINFFKISIAASFTIAAMTVFFGCKKNPEAQKTVDFLSKREDMPSITADSLKTLVSQNGKIKYSIETPKWFVYDRKAEPYWDFPQGLHLDRFTDDAQTVESSVSCLHATYFEKKKLWQLRNNVKARNTAGELFETEELYWDQTAKKVYTDKYIRITQATKIITGTGFESNEDFTRYTILKTQGEFDVNLNE